MLIAVMRKKIALTGTEIASTGIETVTSWANAATGMVIAVIR
jgi:hypothetical protein